MIEINWRLRFVVLLVSISCLLPNKAYPQNPMELPLEILKVVLVDQNTIIPIQHYTLSDRFVEPFHQYFHSETNYIQNLYHDQWIIGYKGETRSFRIQYTDRKDIEYNKAEGDAHVYFEKLRKELSSDALIYDEYKIATSPIIIHWEDLEPISNPWQSPDKSVPVKLIADTQKNRVVSDSLTTTQKAIPIEKPKQECDSLVYLQVIDFDYQPIDMYKVEVLSQNSKVQLPFHQVSAFNYIFLIPQSIRCDVQSNDLTILISADGYLEDTLTLNKYSLQGSTILYKPGQSKIYVNRGIPFIDIGDQYIVFVESPQYAAYKSIIKTYNLKVIEQNEYCRFDKKRVVYKARLGSDNKMSIATRKAMLTDLELNSIQTGLAFKYSHNKSIEGINALKVTARINEEDVYSNRDSIMSFLKNNGFKNVATDYWPMINTGTQQERYFNTRATLPLEMSMNQLRQFINLTLYPNDAVVSISFENIEINCPEKIQPYNDIDFLNKKMNFDPDIFNSDKK